MGHDGVNLNDNNMFFGGIPDQNYGGMNSMINPNNNFDNNSNSNMFMGGKP